MEVSFTTLNVSKDSKVLSVAALVENEASENFVITRIAVDTCATFNEALGGPSAHPIIDKEFASTSASFVEESDTLFKNKILFVWVIVSNGETSYKKLGAIVNWYDIYRMAMCYVKQLPSSCKNPPMAFVDFILKQKGIDYALQTGNYTQAIRLWKTMFNKSYTHASSSSPNGGCGC